MLYEDLLLIYRILSLLYNGYIWVSIWYMSLKGVLYA